MISRDEPQLFSIGSLPVDEVDEPELVRGLPMRLVSQGAGGAFTALASLPADRATTGTARTGRLELFVLEGEIAVDDHPLAPGVFATLPAGDEVRVRAAEPAAVLVFWDPADEAPSRSLYTASAWERPWETNMLPGIPAGLMRKRLRGEDEGPPQGPARGWIRLIHAAPGWRSTTEERHVGCWEENILLRGDMYMRGRGTIAAGDCLANPPALWHGPMATRGGALFLVHCDSPMSVEWRDEETEWVDVEDYLRGAGWQEIGVAAEAEAVRA
jgi:hypothetical protein